MEEQLAEKPKSKLGIIIAIVLVVLCCCVLILAAVGVVAYELYKQMPPISDAPFGPPTATPVVEITRLPTSDVPTDTLDTLQTTIVPENDPYELACRLEGICNVERTVEGKSYQVGDKETFWVINSDTVEHHQVNATLQYVTPHTYFWAEDGANVNEDEVKKLMDTFEERAAG